MAIRVLIVDDQALVRAGFRMILEAQPDLEVVGEVGDGSAAIDAVRTLRPDVVLMDEPCSALDPIATAKVEELIYQLKRDYTIVIVTHNMQQAGRVSDHTAFFYLGRLIEFGSTAKIFSNPGEKQTEDYITGRFG